MKYLVDTCGWIEWITNGKLSDLFEPYLAKLEHLIVPTLIQFELYKWVCREKNSQTALEVIGITENGMVIPLETNLALFAADISKEFGLAMADAIIYATSKQHSCLLITSDKHFRSLPGVKFFEK
jgi:predicted nucleic acid-binding protein